MTERSCGTCRFAFRQGADLLCRRHPPTLNVVIVPAPPPRVGQMMPVPIAGFPPVNDGMWCGEHATKVDPAVIKAVNAALARPGEAKLANRNGTGPAQ